MSRKHSTSASGRVSSPGGRHGNICFTLDTGGDRVRTCECSTRTDLTQWSYDAANRRQSQQAGSATTNYTHDVADQLTSAVTGGQTTGYSFDAAGNMTKVTPPSGPPTTYQWDAANRLSGVVRANGAALTYTYRFDDLLSTPPV